MTQANPFDTETAFTDSDRESAPTRDAAPSSEAKPKVEWDPGPDAGPTPTKLDPPAPGEAGLAARRLGVARMGRFELFSAAFKDGGRMPTTAALIGEDSSPPLHWHSFLPQPASFVLICQDPEAPGPSPFVHWLVYDIPGHALEIDGNLENFKEGLNDNGSVGFTPPAPPAGSGVHTYHFQLFGLDQEIELDEGADLEELLSEMAGHVIAWGELIGTCELT